jgi:hypothetical protein
VDSRLVRTASLVLAPAIVVALLAISTPAALPPPPTAPAFDGASAAALARHLSSTYPIRVPGTPEARLAAAWYRQTMAALGLPTSEQVWTERLPGLGTVELRNIVTVIRGRSPSSIVLVANRDNSPEGDGDNPTGTAALIELARPYGSLGGTRPPVPERTLVLVSTDGGAWGSAGASRYAQQLSREREVVAVVALEGLGRSGRPRLALGAGTAAAPARTLVRTAAARVAEHVGVGPRLPSALDQLLGLALPFAQGEQAPFLARGIAAVTIAGGGSPDTSPGDPARREEAIARLGRAAEAVVGSLAASPRASFPTPDALFYGDRVVSGWAVRTLLVAALAPFAVGLVDLVARARRRRVPFRPALRALMRRVLLWGYVGVAAWIAVHVGALPSGPSLPLPPAVARELSWSPLGVIAFLGAVAVGWIIARRRLAPRAEASSDEDLAGHAAALSWLGAVAVAAALVRPYALLFLLPSLYAWLWLPSLQARLGRLLLFALGLVGPVAGIAVLAHELELESVATVRYLADLTLIGYIPATSVILTLSWSAAAAQLGALALGRYGPYDSDREPLWSSLVRTASERRRRVSHSSGR